MYDKPWHPHFIKKEKIKLFSLQVLSRTRTKTRLVLLHLYHTQKYVSNNAVIHIFNQKIPSWSSCHRECLNLIYRSWRFSLGEKLSYDVSDLWFWGPHLCVGVCLLWWGSGEEKQVVRIFWLYGLNTLSL